MVDFKNMWEIENTHFEHGVQVICGVDEAGRGPLAGPVCAAAVILPAGLVIPGLDDIIQENALAYGIAFASHEEIDRINILQATFLAMERALAQLKIKPDLALIDGNRQKDFGINVETVVKGDSRSANIAAASVLAKVTRDNYMEEMAKAYPGYGLGIHKGYGTKAHYEALRNLGPSPIHRMSFLKKFYAANEA